MKNIRIIEHEECCAKCRHFEVDFPAEWYCNKNGKSETILLAGVDSAKNIVCDDFGKRIIV